VPGASGVYEGIQLNQPLINNLVSMSKELLADISTCCDKLDGIDELTDVNRELKRWQRNIKAFFISKLGSYETPAPAVTVPTQPATPPPPPTVPAPTLIIPTLQTSDIAITEKRIANANPTAKDAGDSATNHTSDATTPPTDNTPSPPN
jgi:hypothetical protein